MYNRLKNLFNSAISESAILLLVCCLVTWTVSVKQAGCWTLPAKCACLGGAVILAAWIAWCVYVFVSKREVREMPTRRRLMMETLSGLMMIYWIVVSGNAAYAWPWIIWFCWIAAAACLSLLKRPRA